MKALPTIASIGAGHMGSSLISGLIQKGVSKSKLLVSDKSEAALSKLKAQFSLSVTQDNLEAAKKADVIIFAVKPQFFAEVAEELAPVIKRRKPLVISIAAGITLANMEEWLGKDIPIVRTMPNTPALIGEGATALFANSVVTSAQKELADTILGAVGITVWVEKEAWLDIVTALSGSGPAYFFLIMDALQAAAQELGLPAEIAKRLTLQTALGAARMAMASEKSLASLREAVTSKGGTTEKAIYVLEEHNIYDILQKTLQAAKLRSEELAKK